MSEFMYYLHIFKDQEKVGEISVEPDRQAIRFAETIEELIEDEITRIFTAVKQISDDTAAERFKEAFAVKGYTVLREDEVADPKTLLESREVTPEDRRAARFIYESNGIEDITEISYEDILQRVVRNDETGCAGAWRWTQLLAKSKIPLKFEHVCEMHRLMADEQAAIIDFNGGSIHEFIPEAYRGVLRLVAMEVPADPNPIKEVPTQAQVDEFFIKFNQAIKGLGHKPSVEMILQAAAPLHLEYEDIHPLYDINGRTGRLIVNYMLLYFGFKPLVCTAGDKGFYYEGFQTPDDPTVMAQYFIRKYKESEGFEE